ncbi:hypothetical protein BJF90_20640 [Pseudonocardia sp. CNS-004]|nr:hypothetical protein BJF90_20640 [Pseudonocardia sp. CNS-004]
MRSPTNSAGTVTRAVTPRWEVPGAPLLEVPIESVNSPTEMPWRRASFPTTNRPIRRDAATDAVDSTGLRNRSLRVLSSPGESPMPSSKISTRIDPSRAWLQLITTWLSPGEKLVALSSSSASMCWMSLEALAANVASGGFCTTTRW